MKLKYLQLLTLLYSRHKDNVYSRNEKKDLYEFFCNSSFILYTVLEQMHEGYILSLKY